jgi:hypothetical protein
MSLLPMLIVAWAVVIPVAVIGAFQLASRACPTSDVARPQGTRPATVLRTCESRRRTAAVVDSRRVLRHHG